MAQKRMFDKKVVGSDKFIDLPNSTKALYFMAGMEADDKGFFQPKKLQRMCGFSDDDFKILIAKRFFIAFESGVMVVTDWNKNNWLDKRRITETEYIDELKMLKMINEKYELLSKEDINAKPMLSEYSIEENSIVENRIEYKEKDNNKLLSKKKESFCIPTLEEVKQYCEERNNKVDAESFIDFYESKGWVVGKTKMKDWKACIRTWERNDKQKPKKETREELNARILKELEEEKRNERE